MRHGVSCVNAGNEFAMAHPDKPYKTNKTYKWYQDPPLTEFGIQKCKERRGASIAAINSKFPLGDYQIGTSCLIRAQQTAFYTLLEGTGVKYSIIPHIGEEDEGAIDNIPLSPENQQKILEFPRTENDGQNTVEKKNLYSDVPEFYRWINALRKEEAEHFFHVTPAGDYHAVIFTHKKFIKDLLHLDKKENVNNNDIYYVELDTETQGIRNLEKLLSNEELKNTSGAGCDLTLEAFLNIPLEEADKAKLLEFVIENPDKFRLRLEDFVASPLPHYLTSFAAAARGGSRKRGSTRKSRARKFTRSRKYKRE